LLKWLRARFPIRNRKKERKSGEKKTMKGKRNRTEEQKSASSKEKSLGGVDVEITDDRFADADDLDWEEDGSDSEVRDMVRSKN
uniref:DNAJ heat shock N-terminal domain-containing protein n=1 Tax=Gongylonema pulchrum TaxID=637853 RepID=A0A183DIX8_9BILA